MTILSAEKLNRFYEHFPNEDHGLILIDADPGNDPKLLNWIMKQIERGAEK